MKAVTSNGNSAKPGDDRIVPLFPLTGVLLLPGNFLPLNVFEPRYRNLIEDALAARRVVGMIQPCVPAADNMAPASPSPSTGPPALYDVGCLGQIDRCQRQSDGRYVLLLRGVQRFRVAEELPLLRGYRRAVADFEGFSADRDAKGDEPPGGDRLLSEALTFARRFELDFDPDLLSSLGPRRLLNVLASALPFRPSEKQALLEAPTTDERQEVLLTLMRMTSEDQTLGEADDEPTIVH